MWGRGIGKDTWSCEMLCGGGGEASIHDLVRWRVGGGGGGEARIYGHVRCVCVMTFEG